MSFLIDMTVVIVVVANKSIDLVFDYCCKLCQRMYTRVLKGLYHCFLYDFEYKKLDLIRKLNKNNDEEVMGDGNKENFKKRIMDLFNISNGQPLKYNKS